MLSFDDQTFFVDASCIAAPQCRPDGLLRKFFVANTDVLFVRTIQVRVLDVSK